MYKRQEIANQIAEELRQQTLDGLQWSSYDGYWWKPVTSCHVYKQIRLGHAVMRLGNGPYHLGQATDFDMANYPSVHELLRLVNDRFPFVRPKQDLEELYQQLVYSRYIVGNE